MRDKPYERPRGLEGSPAFLTRALFWGITHSGLASGVTAMRPCDGVGIEIHRKPANKSTRLRVIIARRTDQWRDTDH